MEETVSLLSVLGRKLGAQNLLESHAKQRKSVPIALPSFHFKVLVRSVCFMESGGWEPIPTKYCDQALYSLASQSVVLGPVALA